MITCQNHVVDVQGRKKLLTAEERRKKQFMNKHKILLIEDDTEISEMLTNYLMTENYEVICAADGQEACNQFDTSTFSLVLLDLTQNQRYGRYAVHQKK